MAGVEDLRPGSIRRVCAGAAVLLVVGLAIPALPIRTADAQGLDRVALVIGNSGYEALPSLANPRNDAEAVADALTGIGFRVTTVTDGDRQRLEQGLAEFAKSAAGADIALFYYAGHGVQINGENHLLPVSVEATSADTILNESLTLAEVRSELQAAGPSLLVVVLDSCRENPFGALATATTGESVSRLTMGTGLAPTEGGVGLLIAYATQPGQIAYDGTGPNSPFTDALLDHVGTPGLDIRLMFGRVREQVVVDTRGAQIPWVEEAVLGEAFIAGRRVASDDAGVAAGEEAFWRRIRTSDDPADFEAYQRLFPDGIHAVQARNRKLALEAQAERVAASSIAGDLTEADIRKLKNSLYWLGFYAGALGPAADAEFAAAITAFADRMGLEPVRALEPPARRQIHFAAATALIGLGERLADRIAFDGSRLAAIDEAIETIALPALADLQDRLPPEDPDRLEAEAQIAEMTERRDDLAERLQAVEADYLIAVAAAGAGYADLLTPAGRAGLSASRGSEGASERRSVFIRHALAYAEEGEIDDEEWLRDLR